MQVRILERLELLGTGLAILALTAFLGLTLMALGRMNADNSGPTYASMVQVSSLQRDVQGLITAAERQDLPAVLSGWRTLETGLVAARPKLAAIIENSPYPGQFTTWLRDIEAPIRALARAQPADATAFSAVRTRAEQLRFTLHNTMTSLAQHGSRQMAERAASFGTALWGIVACVVGSLLCGGWLVARLIQSVRRARQAETELRRHRDQLEHTVAQRTRELANTEGQLRNAIGTAPDGFVAFTADGRLLVANEAALTALPGIAAHLAVGTPLADVLAATQAFPGLLVGTEAPRLDVAELESPGGRWTLVTLRQAGDGTAVMRFADITAAKQATLTLERALLRERTLRRLYRDFVAMVSHQFRTPLAIIDSGAQKILRRGPDMAWPDIAERALQIRSAATGLVALVDGTLDGAGLDDGEMDFNPRDVDLGHLLTELGSRLQDIHQRRRLTIDVAALPQLVRCDPLLVEHAISNLVSNSAKYSGDNTVVSITAQSSDRTVTITVRDQGVGIPREEIDRVFELSYRGRNATGTSGSGVGLHVARRIVRLHGGDIRVVSTIGAGTSVAFDLPRDASPRVAA